MAAEERCESIQNLVEKMGGNERGKVCVRKVKLARQSIGNVIVNSFEMLTVEAAVCCH